MRHRDDGNVYKVRIVESASPLTKRPSTSFRLSALGLMEEEVCRKSVNTVSVPIVSKPNDIPVVSSTYRRECDLDINKEEFTGTVGDSFTVKVDHGTNSDIFEGYDIREIDGVTVKQVKEGLEIKSTKPFYGEILVTAKYGYCMTCEFYIYVEFEDKEEPAEEVLRDCGIEITPFNLRVDDITRMNRNRQVEEEFRVGDDTIAEITVQSDGVLVKALKIGETFLEIKNRYDDGTACSNTVEIVVT